MTGYRSGPTGCPECRIKKCYSDRNIFTVGTANQVFLFFSPRYPRSYGQSRFVKYNIDCGEGRLAYLEFLDMDLEPRNCLNRCVDYVHVDAGPQGTYQVCGCERPTLNLGSSSLMVIFRSNHRRNYPGFAARVICYQRYLAGCKQKRQTPDEQGVLNTLAQPQLDFARELEQTEHVDPAGPNSANREYSTPRFTFKDADIRLALKHENTCSPVLRAAARSVIEETQKYDPDRVIALRLPPIDHSYDVNIKSLGDGVSKSDSEDEDIE